MEIVVSDVARQQADLVLSSDVSGINVVPSGHISVTSSVEAGEPTPLFTTCELCLMKSYHKGLKVLLSVFFLYCFTG